jgi:hypothetical protein
MKTTDTQQLSFRCVRRTCNENVVERNRLDCTKFEYMLWVLS